jgi:IS1 family transposase
VANTTAQPTGNFGKQVDDKKQELIKLLDQMEAESLMTDEHKELQQLLANRFSAPKGYRREIFSGAWPTLAGFATAFVIFGR